MESRAGDLFAGLLAASGRADASVASVQVDQFVGKLEARDKSHEASFLKKLFKKTHQQFLRHYVVHSDFGDLFQNGNYDCLTATALFATLLDRFEYDYEIYETNYHIFLIVQTQQGKVLIESTDPIYGFESGEMAIEARLQTYLRANEGKENTYRYQQDTFRSIEKTKLPGLLLFNQAVNAFNADDVVGAAEKLIVANRIYRAERNVELAALIIQRAAALKLDDAKQVQIQSALLKVLGQESFASR